MKSAFAQLLEQKTEKENLRIALNKFEEAQTNFSHPLRSKEKLEQEGVTEEKKLEIEKIRQAEIRQLLQELSAGLNQLKPQYERLP
ncbi:MAG: hypothetical protein AAGE79_14380, partial [Acinetobacter pittii]